MFGYIVMNKPEIKFKDFDLYRSFYCGLCRELKSKYGISGQISLTYDMTFVVILLSALYEPPTQKGSTRCIIHPVCKQPVRRNTVTEYAADMNVLLTYYKCRDDWEDEKKVTALGYSKVLQGKVKNWIRNIRINPEEYRSFSVNCLRWRNPAKKTLTKWRAVSEKLWKRFLHGNRMYGKILCAEWDFFLANLFIFWMHTMMWKRI